MTWRHLALILLALTAPAGRPQQASRPAEGCRTCHRREHQDLLASAHARAQVSCVACHGGDPAATDEKKAHGGTFRGRIRRTSIPGLCADCHSDIRRMTPYGLRADQYQQYAVSSHGVAILRKAKEGAAVCTDCHGTHRILFHNDPRSPTHRRNLASMCARCHSDRERMEPVGLRSGTVEDYLAGAHGKALTDGTPEAPTCATCHGVHAFAPPGTRAVAEVCGRCHQPERDAFLASRHAGAKQGDGVVRCTSCHHTHRTLPITTEGLGTVCRTCHEGQDERLRMGLDLTRRILAIEARSKEILSLLDEASRDLAVVDRAGQLREEVLPLLARVKARSHSLNAAGLDRFRSRLEVILTEALELARRREEEIADRRLLLLPAWIVLGGLAAALLTLRGLAGTWRRLHGSRTAAEP